MSARGFVFPMQQPNKQSAWKEKGSPYKKLGVLFIVLALPGICYYLLQEKGENRYKSLPVYGEKVLSGTTHSHRGKEIPDTLYHQVAPFTLPSIDGPDYTFPPDTGISVVSIAAIDNPALSDRLEESMQQIAERFKNNGLVTLYTLVIRPDSTHMPAYEQLYQRWHFLLGGEQIEKIARKDLLLNVVLSEDGGGSGTHPVSLVLIDSQRRIRGYYNALDAKEMDLLIDEVKLLLTEEIRSSNKVTF